MNKNMNKTAMSTVEKLRELWRWRWNLIGTPAAEFSDTELD